MKLLCEIVDFKDIDVIKEDVEIDGEVKKQYFLKGPFLQAEIKNRNGRKYMKETLLREVKKFYDTKIKTKRSLGELDHPSCYLYTYQVLTKNGWVEFVNLNAGDMIQTLNIETGIIEEKPINKIINEYYKGHAYHLHGRNIDSKVTPTHRFLLENIYGKKEFVTIEDIYLNRKKYNKHKIIKLGNWIGNDTENIVIKGLTDEEYYSTSYWNYKNDVREDLVIDAKTFCQFMGIWLSEGCVVKSRKGVVLIHQRNEENKKLIKKMLSKFPIKWSEYKDRFSISDIRLWNFLYPLGDCYTKYVPYEVKQLSPIYLNELIDWFIMGDGRDQGRRRNLFSVSKRLVEDLHECLIKCGGSGNYTKYICENGYEYSGHIIKPDNKVPLYQLNLSTTTGIYLDERFLDIDKIDHDGNVYCLSVENENFYIKDKDKCYWTGNSPTVNLERVSHVITELEMKDNVGYGKAKIIDTPMGRIAKILVDENIVLGMSTRGVGSLDGELVKDDFNLITIDIVADPSAPNALVDGVLENKEFVIGKDGEIVEKAVETLQKSVDEKCNKYSRKDMSYYTLQYLNEFIESIRRKTI